MSVIKYALAIALASSLAACGGGSKSTAETAPTAPKEPVTVTADNVSKALTIQGAEPASFELPATTPTALTASNRVLVSANSAFPLNLSVPASVLGDRQVAGYLIVLPDGTQQFVRVATAAPATAAHATPTQNAKIAGNKHEQTAKKANINADLRQVRAGAQNEGLTRVVIAGWNASDFNLEQNLDNLNLRILPLLVNKSVRDLANLSLTQLQQQEGFDLSLEQTLVLAIEAVATSAIQATLTWDTTGDIDLYVVEPNDNRIYYGKKFSSASLGWLDRDNTVSYGPENITFNYQLPEGDYKVVVNYYSGSQEVNYALVVKVGNAEPTVYEGTFNSTASVGTYYESSDFSETADPVVGNHLVHTFHVDTAFNAQLTPQIPNSQYLGVWQVVDNAADAIEQYITITATGIAVDGCDGGNNWNTEFLPSGFRVHNSTLQVSDALINSDRGNGNFTYAYKNLILVNSDIAPNCVDYTNGNEAY